MKKKQKYVTVFVVLLFCVLARATVSDNSTADELYQKAIDSIQNDGDRGSALSYAEDALDAYSKANDTAGVKKCDELIQDIRGHPIVSYLDRGRYFFEKGVNNYSAGNCTNGKFLAALKDFEVAKATYARINLTDRVQEVQSWIDRMNASLKACGPAGSTTAQLQSSSTSIASSSTTLLPKVAKASQQQDTPSGNQILLVAAGIVLLSVVGVLFLARGKK